jgi:alpha-tubulin suppressor-like RCC1 family protein
LVSNLHPSEYELNIANVVDSSTAPLSRAKDHIPPEILNEELAEAKEGVVESEVPKEEGMLGYLMQITAAKQHILYLTERGEVYSYGKGVYGVCGQGGAKSCSQQQILRPLSERKVMQIACGEYHSLALTQMHDLYSWGRGFEGQLGLSTKTRIEIVARPSFVAYFNLLKVKNIAAGSYYSLAITDDGELYGWGEARLGQLGCGKQSLVFTPQKITIKDEEPNILQKSQSNISSRSVNPNPCEDYRVRKVAAGFGHTAVITEDDSLFMWGLNTFGQLGIGERRNIRWRPVRLEKDITNNWMPKIKDVACGYNFTFVIDCKFMVDLLGEGKLYSWGKGYIGHNRLTEDDKPRRIESKTQNRKFTALFCNSQAVVLFAPMQVYSLSPRCGPSSGGTVLSIIGTALKSTKDIRVRFTYGKEVKEVTGSYVEQWHADQRFNQDQPALQSIFCTTPNFESEVKEGEEVKVENKIKFPQKATISVSLDGINYNECEQDYLIYPSGIKIDNSHPKCGPVLGGTELVMMIDLDPTLTGYLFNMCFGFQERPMTNQQAQDNEEEKKESGVVAQKTSRRTSKVGRLTSRVTRLGNQGQAGTSVNMSINPLTPTDEQLQLGNWLCTTADNEGGKITCRTPKLIKYDAENLQYNVDVALNGQQFSGYPILFRYYS